MYCTLEFTYALHFLNYSLLTKLTNQRPRHVYPHSLNLPNEKFPCVHRPYSSFTSQMMTHHHLHHPSSPTWPQALPSSTTVTLV